MVVVGSTSVVGNVGIPLVAGNNTVRQVECAGTLIERSVTDILDSVGDRNICEQVAVVKSVITDSLNAGKVSLHQTVAVSESVAADSFQVSTGVELIQVVAPVESILGNIGNAVGNSHVNKLIAPIKSADADSFQVCGKFLDADITAPPESVAAYDLNRIGHNDAFQSCVAHESLSANSFYRQTVDSSGNNQVSGS